MKQHHVCCAEPQTFSSFEEFEAFLRLEGSSKAYQFARKVWNAGHRSFASIARARSELAVQLGGDIEDLIAFCWNRSGMHAYVSGLYQRLCYREMCLV